MESEQPLSRDELLALLSARTTQLAAALAERDMAIGGGSTTGGGAMGGGSGGAKKPGSGAA